MTVSRCAFWELSAVQTKQKIFSTKKNKKNYIIRQQVISTIKLFI